MMATTTLAFIGTSTASTSKGIYTCRVDQKSGRLEQIAATSGLANPSFLALHPVLPVLYSINEIGEFAGAPQGALSAFAIDAASGQLTLVGTAPTGGPGPCHVTVDKSGRFAFAANYGGGSVGMIRLRDDGAPDALTDFVQHEGRSVNPDRQMEPHAHQVRVDPSNRFLYACDLGLDSVMIYAIDAAEGKLRPHGRARMQPGAGPRHLAFHPNGRFAYVINELDNTVTVTALSPDGALRELQIISTLPLGYAETSYCADIHISADGRFLYGSNRGHDSIAAFSIDAATGLLSALDRTATGGKWPRNFALGPSGRVYVANQNTDDVIVFDTDAVGALQRVPGKLSVPSPLCVVFGAF